MMPAPAGAAPRTTAATLETELTTRAMGGGLYILVASTPDDGDAAEDDVRRVAGRIDAWAQRLTRFSATSDLGILNADPDRSPADLRPTLASVLAHARTQRAATEGTVEVTMLDERLAAETGGWSPPAASPPAASPPWHLTGTGRRVELVRHGPMRFDLDGVAKGWIADRALRLLEAYPSALVDADGDVAVRTSATSGWSIGVAHPFDGLAELARLRPPDECPSDTFGVATSGTSVHRWDTASGRTHHLIDPHTRRPAVTEVVQATVVARSAGEAEALAKTAVIRGTRDGLELLGRAGAWAALLLLDDGSLRQTPGTSRWLA